MTPFQNPTIYIGTLRVDEPITVLTDLIFCAICFYAFYKTYFITKIKAIKLYSLFFLTTGISTLIAALVGHAFLYHFGIESKIYGWVLGIFSIAFSQFAALYHTKSIIGDKLFKFLLRAFFIEVILGVILTFYFWTFIVVIIHTTFAFLIVVTTLESLKYKKTKSALSKYVIIGVALMMIAALCHLLKLGFGIWFNHLDVSHIFMILSVTSMYIGVKNFKKVKH